MNAKKPAGMRPSAFPAQDDNPKLDTRPSATNSHATANGRSGQDEAPAPGRELPLLWSIDRAAVALSVSSKTVKRMVAAQEIPGVVRLGRRVLISRVALEAWIAQGCPPVRRGRR